MEMQQFEAITRRAAEGMSRRGTLATLGGVALASALGKPTTTEAKKKKCGKKVKKAKKQAEEQAEEQCQTQVDECNASIQTFCNQLGEGPTCITVLSTCCNLMANCNIGAGVTCLVQFIAA